MYIDENGRSILGVWNEEKQQWIMDLQGLVTVKTLAAQARKRLEENPTSAGAVFVPFTEMTAEEIEEARAQINQQDELLRDVELALFEIEARANEVNEANQ